jgi:hypothetical protein
MQSSRAARPSLPLPSFGGASLVVSPMLAGAWAVTVTSLPFAPAWWRAALAQCLTKRQRRLPVSPDFRSLRGAKETRVQGGRPARTAAAWRLFWRTCAQSRRIASDISDWPRGARRRVTSAGGALIGRTILTAVYVPMQQLRPARRRRHPAGGAPRSHTGDVRRDPGRNRKSGAVLRRRGADS